MSYDHRQKTHQTELYAQDQIALDSWHLTPGGREDWIHAGTMFYNRNDATSTSRDKKFSDNAALSYVFDNGLTSYLFYAESFQPSTGADNIGSNKVFRPTEDKQWELDVKYQPVGSDLLFTAAVYDLRQENVRATDDVNRTSTTSRVGKVEVTSLELEATSNATDDLKVIGSHSHTDTEIKKDQYTGNHPQQAPHNQASLRADYTWHEGTLNGPSVGADAHYVGSTYGDQANTYDGRADSYILYDATVCCDLGQLNGSLKGVSVTVGANNLFNEDYLASCDGYYCYYSGRRSVVGSVSYKQ